MSFDILGKDIAVLFILAVIFGIATYFYVLHKGKKEKRTASAEDKIILGFEVLVSYICCLIAKYSAIYNQIETDDDKNLGYE